MPSFDQIRPRLARSVAQGVADQAGGVAYGGAVEGSTNVAFGGPTADFILYGVVNGAFAQGPPDPNDYIDPQINPMPYWQGPTNVSGGAIQVSWAADASSPSGYNLRFTVNPGAAGDEAYMEQIVPIGGMRAQWDALLAMVEWLRVSATDINGFQLYLSATYLNAAGSTTGATQAATATFSSNVLNYQTLSVGGTSSGPPSDGQTVRLRIGVKRNTAATTDSGVFDFVSVRTVRTAAKLLIPEWDKTTLYGPGYIYGSNGAIQVDPQGTAVASFNPTIGFLSYVATTLGGSVVYSGVITDTIAGNKNNYAPSGLATSTGIVATITGADRTITGFSASGLTSGQMFYYRSIGGGGFNTILADKSTSSSSGNRISCPGALDFTVRQTGGVWIVYDPLNNPTNPFCVIAP